MDGEDTWSKMQTYVGGGGSGGRGCAHDKKMMIISSTTTAANNSLMMRFRPIAPKPVTGESFPVNNKNLLFKGKRSKRKYVRVRTNNTNNRKKRISLDHEKNQKKTAVTLQLLPEKNNQRDSASSTSPPSNSSDLDRTVDENTNQTSWLKLNNDFFGESLSRMPVVSDLTVSKPVAVVESWVTVECITDACMADGNGFIFSVTPGLGSTDAERLTNLDEDTCPSFVSDGWNRVRWINEAYRKMITKQEGEGGIVSPETTIIVWLMLKQKVRLLYGEFSCRVRIEYTWRKEKYSKIVPCDVWRMDSGGFAWRLDIKAALGLGL